MRHLNMWTKQVHISKPYLWIYRCLGCALLGLKKWVNSAQCKWKYIQYITKLNAKQNGVEFKGVDYGFVVKPFWVY